MVGVPKKSIGKSVQPVVVKGDSHHLKRYLESIKTELLAEIAKVLVEIKSTQNQTFIQVDSIDPQNDIPMFVPNINNIQDHTANINISDSKSASDELDKAVEALKKLKNKESKDE